MRPQVSAVVVTYRCRSSVDGLLAVLQPQVVRTYVIDNGSGPQGLATLQSWAQKYPESFRLTCNANNVGIAAAQNQGIRQAVADGAEWVLLMDHDSVPDQAMVSHLLVAAQISDERTAIFAPRLVEQNVSAVARYLVSRLGFWFSRCPVSVEGELEAVTAIASGSLIRAELFRAVGLMNEGYFIDYVDHEFCLRARAHNYLVKIIGSAVLHHRQGNKRRVMGVVTRNYSRDRYYYQFRNRMFFLRCYGLKFPFLISHEIMAYSWDLLRLIIFECGKYEKFRAACHGLWHGLTRPLPLPAEL